MIIILLVLLHIRILLRPRISLWLVKMKKGRLRVAAGVGVTVDTMDRAKALVEAGVDAIVIDTAHGHSKGVVENRAQVKAAFPNVDVVVGNVATGAAAKYLVDNGADAVKVGIGLVQFVPHVLLLV